MATDSTDTKQKTKKCKQEEMSKHQRPLTQYWHESKKKPSKQEEMWKSKRPIEIKREVAKRVKMKHTENKSIEEINISPLHPLEILKRNQTN